MIHGIDVSFAQYGNGNPDWNAAKASGKVRFVFARATYGTNPADDDGPAYVNAHDQCKALGIPQAPYMFWLAGQDGAAQAQHFLDAIDGREGTLAPMVDVEEGSGACGWGISVAANVACLSATLTTIQNALKAQPILYTNADTWATYFGNTDAFSGHRLFIASYSDAPGSPAIPSGWDTWAAHQYSSTGAIPGFSGNVDLDCCVDLSELAK